MAIEKNLAWNIAEINDTNTNNSKVTKYLKQPYNISLLANDLLLTVVSF